MLYSSFSPVKKEDDHLADKSMAEAYNHPPLL